MTNQIFNLHFVKPQHGMDRYPLPQAAASVLSSFIQEQQKSELLATHGLEPRNKVLLLGRSCKDKAIIAEALAFELNLPFVRVNYNDVLSGPIALARKNALDIFKYAHSTTCVLFLDEFGEGLTPSHVGYASRDIATFNNQIAAYIEQLPSTCILVAATEASGMLTREQKSLFPVQITLDSLTTQQKLACAQIELGSIVVDGLDLKNLIERVAGHYVTDLSECIEFCQNIRRDLVLNGGANIDSFFPFSADHKDIKPFEDIEQL